MWKLRSELFTVHNVVTSACSLEGQASEWELNKLGSVTEYGKYIILKSYNILLMVEVGDSAGGLCLMVCGGLSGRSHMFLNVIIST